MSIIERVVAREILVEMAGKVARAALLAPQQPAEGGFHAYSIQSGSAIEVSGTRSMSRSTR